MDTKVSTSICDKRSSSQPNQQATQDLLPTNNQFRNQTLHGLFEEQAKRIPHQIAVIHEEEILTYKMLNIHANQLARQIRQKYHTSPSNPFIVIYMERGIDMIIAILGVLKAGGAYVPIDPGTDKDKIAHILQETNPGLILTQNILIKHITDYVALDSCVLVDKNNYESNITTNLKLRSESTDLAYAIYASGTKDQPLGVMVSHYNVLRLINSIQIHLSLGKQEKILQHFSIAFDASVLEIFITFFTGAMLCIIPEEARKDPLANACYLSQHGISFAIFPPNLLSQIEDKELNCLQKILVAGEINNHDVIKKWQKNRLLFTGYIPTECTVLPTIHCYNELRVEIQELEAQLSQHPLVESCAVVNRVSTTQEDTLIAFAVLKKSVAEPDSIQSIRLLFEQKSPLWWPSVSDYGFYDEFIYETLTKNKTRELFYRTAFTKYVPNKVILDVGTGKDLFLARLCVACGAKKVYAVECLESAYQQALALLQREKLENKIELILGDIRFIELPEKIDVCVSQLIGLIGSSEGVIPINQFVKEHCLKSNSKILPSESKTHIVAACLPDHLVKKPKLSPISSYYTKRIFENEQHTFDLRFSLLNFSPKYMLSNKSIFEHLIFEKDIATTSSQEIVLDITRPGRLNSFIFWTSIIMDDSLIFDAEMDEFMVPPMVFVLDRHYQVHAGDRILLTTTSAVSSTSRSCDYMLSGKVVKKDGKHYKIFYRSEHISSETGKSRFHRSLFNEGVAQHLPSPKSQQVKKQVKQFLHKKLPHFLQPNDFTILDKLPMTINGKIDRAALLNHHQAPKNKTQENRPVNEIEHLLRLIWIDVFGTKNISIHDNFFELGGNSLMVTLIVSRFNASYPRLLRVSEIFAHPTIVELAEVLLNKKDQLLTAITLLPSLTIKKGILDSSMAVAGKISQVLLKKLHLQYSSEFEVEAETETGE
ncbi:MAG: AMP-binding protein [Legionellaceae bacterium]|nr:AMP-binding protein [Legionellaceae bacterium]